MRIVPFGEGALLVELESGSLRPSALGRRLAAALLRNDGPAVDRGVAEPSAECGIDGVDDVVVGEESVVVLFDPLRCDVAALGETLFSFSSASSAPGLLRTPQPWPPDGEDLEHAPMVNPVPIRYDGEDLRSVADLVGLSVEEVVVRHAAPIYEVTMIGFVPGFCYLSGLDPVLALPRLDMPRPRVPAGAVGIAGLRSCIYPMATPGGWRLLGRTSLSLWAPAEDPPARFRAGDRLRFVVDRT